MLIDGYDNDEEEDDEMKHYAIKEDGSCSAVKRNDDNNEIKATKSNGADNEMEVYYETEGVKCKILQENSAFTEVLFEMLVSDLKTELISVMNDVE